MMKRLLVGIVAILFFAGMAQAATETSTLLVEANVNASCAVSTTAVTFVGYDGLSEVTATGDVSVQCSPTTAYNIALDAGGNLNAGWRNLSDGTNLLPYYLNDPANVIEWGDNDYANTYTFAASLADTGDGTLQGHVVNAVLPPLGVPATPGYYSDIVNVTVHF